MTSTRSRPLERFEENVIVAHREVLSLDEHVAEIAREISLLEISFVVRAGREHDDARIFRLARRDARERILDVAKITGEPMDVDCRETIPAVMRAVTRRLARA